MIPSKKKKKKNLAGKKLSVLLRGITLKLNLMKKYAKTNIFVELQYHQKRRIYHTLINI